MAFMRAPYNNDGSGGAEDAKGSVRAMLTGFKVAKISELKAKTEAPRPSERFSSYKTLTY
jgi:hypothetical protein